MQWNVPSHYALRKSGGETVKEPENIRPTLGSEGSGLEGTIEDRQKLDLLFSLAYEELRRLASSVKRGDPGATLSPTTL